MKIKMGLCFSIGLLVNHSTDATTLVYSMRIRRIFNIARNLLQEHKPLLVGSAVPILYARDRHIVDATRAIDVCDKHLIGGSLFNIRYIPSEHWWFEATTGLEKETACEHGTTHGDHSRVGLDDIVLSGGYNMFPDDNSQVTVYGLGGLPTKKKVTLQERFDTLVGTRFYSLGAGVECSYSFINEKERIVTAIFQARFLHFFERNWFPILPCDAKIQPGNATDFLFTGQYRHAATIFEAGYNPTLFTNQAVRLKTGTVEAENFIRNSIYASISHGWKDFPGLHMPLILGTGLSVGQSKRFDTRIISWWVNFTTLF